MDEAHKRRHAHPNARRENGVRREGGTDGGDEQGNRGQQSNGLHEISTWFALRPFDGRPVAAPCPGPLSFRVPLLTVLVFRQQAGPRFRSRNVSAAGPPLIAPVDRAHRFVRSGPRPERTLSFKVEGFSGAKVASASLQGLPPLLYEAHRRNIASI